MEKHNQLVAQIASSVKDFYDKKQKFRIYRGATNSSRNQTLRDRKNVVDTSGLNSVLKVDTEKMLAYAEANVPMDKLVEATLAYDLTPAVVADFPGITVGGGYSGTTGESSSYKHGFFNQTLESVEMVLANGEVVTCSDTNMPDLFYGAAGGLGSFGVVTMLAIRLEKAQKYVETTYHPVSSIEEAVEKVKHFTSGAQYDKFDYVDGILWSKTSGAIITGRRTNERTPVMDVTRFSAPSDPWFAWHVEERLKDSKGPVTELIPLPEYYFRYDRGGFWVGASIFEMTKGVVPFNKRTRYWLDDFLHTRMLYAAMHSLYLNIQIIQDVAIPMSAAKEFIEWETEEIKIWPLWLCPLKQSPAPTLHPHTGEKKGDGTPELMLNVGIWGSPLEADLDCYLNENKAIEDKLHEVGGMKWMYAASFASEEDWWRPFDRKWYDALREKYHATTLPTIFDKARHDPKKLEQHVENFSWKDALPIMLCTGGGLALGKAWLSGEWKKKRKSTWMNWVPREKGE
ncbi:hypothetical protein CERZMDRAFT_111448 [Cercospora zeae-maydis SCOH1-5]|uniref:Delta(24)-sterol reductase n=1 Tax=Cercospora zeae-maydis SCOH1-5 TaxID=717836 RepID=A0A6A6FIF9_9PEZI|nr:hypothetical protein CERZMDRAFT_111448 [Cercospora zeae-maydis SCOH1-5]